MKINTKRKFFVLAISIVIIVGGVSINAYVTEKKKQQVFVITGLPEKQTGILKELNIVTTEHAYIDKGYEYLRNGQFNKALEQFEIVLKRNQKTGALPEARRGIVDVHEKMRDYKTASELLKNIVDRFKIPKGDIWRTPEDERLLCLDFASEGDYDLAVQHAQKALEADATLPNRPEGGREDYVERLNDLKVAREYILSLKKK